MHFIINRYSLRNWFSGSSELQAKSILSSGLLKGNLLKWSRAWKFLNTRRAFKPYIDLFETKQGAWLWICYWVAHMFVCVLVTPTEIKNREVKWTLAISWIIGLLLCKRFPLPDQMKHKMMPIYIGAPIGCIFIQNLCKLKPTTLPFHSTAEAAKNSSWKTHLA